MKLHEHDKYNGSHRARKSYHFFNGMIVCLGTDIENTNEEFPTETTVSSWQPLLPKCMITGQLIKVTDRPISILTE